VEYRNKTPEVQGIHDGGGLRGSGGWGVGWGFKFIRGWGVLKNLVIPGCLSRIVCIHAGDQLAGKGGWGVGGGQVAQESVFMGGSV
jgi:hypothetical protein